MLPSLHELFDQCLGGLLITNHRGKVVYINNAIAAKYGFGYGEIIDKSSKNLWGGSVSPSFYQELWEQIAVRKQPFIADIKNNTKNSSAIIEQIHIYPILDRNHVVRFFLELSLPTTATESAVNQFHQEGISLFKNTAKFERYFLNWSIGWLSNHSVNTSIIKQLFTKIRAPSLHEFLQTELINPMHQRLHLRYEDYSLVSAAQKNSQNFAELYHKYYKAIFNYIMHRTNFKHDIAEDITQDVFMRAFEHLSAFKLSNASYKTYLLTIAHNSLVNYYRGTKPVNLAEANTIISEDNLIEQIAQQQDIAYLLQELHPLESTILQLKYQRGLSIRDIAKQVNKSENAIKLILSRSRKKLRQHHPEF